MNEELSLHGPLLFKGGHFQLSHGTDYRKLETYALQYAMSITAVSDIAYYSA